MQGYAQVLSGGVLMGLASWIMLAGVGRVTNISAITSGVLTSRRLASGWRWAFLFGLVGGGALFSWLLGAPRVELRSSLMLVPAGLMVGFGAVLGSGCTSGHGICGLGRRSRRLLAAVAVFMGTAVTTVLVTAHLPPAEWWGSMVIDGLTSLFGR